MSRERREEIQRQGFIDALFGIEPNSVMDVLPSDNPYRIAYREGRRLGRSALANADGIKLRDKIEVLYKQYESASHV